MKDRYASYCVKNVSSDESTYLFLDLMKYVISTCVFVQFRLNFIGKLSPIVVRLEHFPV